MDNLKEELSEDTFGSPGRIKEYKILLYFGLGMLAIGGPLLFLKENWMIIGSVLVFIGLMCAVSGWLGLKEEKTKYGIKRKSTTTGFLALILGILSVFLSNGPYISLIIGPLAIILGIKSIKEGDNEYGSAGGICGAIGFIINLYVMFLFTFFT